MNISFAYGVLARAVMAVVYTSLNIIREFEVYKFEASKQSPIEF